MEDPEYGKSSTSQPTQPRPVRHININAIPQDILQNEALNKAIATLPQNYSFEIHKTLWRLRKTKATRVALQFPEGLLMYSCIISDILQTFGNVESIILGDVTYGACCIDDLSAISLGCDFLVHYGHSCLVPIDVCQIPTLYVFVDITFNSDHLITMLFKHFDPATTHLILAGTIQFSSTIQTVYKIVKSTFPHIYVPQAKPLSQGEVLGCTSPKLTIDHKASNQSSTHSCGSTGQASCTNTGHGATPDGISLEELPPDLATQSFSQLDEEIIDLSNITPGSNNNNNNNNNNNDNTDSKPNFVCVFLADGRFHLESLMIQNPHIPKYYRYDPYNRMMTEESYDIQALHARRYESIQTAKEAKKWGVVLGTLGRQGSTHILTRIENCLRKHNVEFTSILLSEIFPTKLSILSTQCDAWVQIACPRLSVDWAKGFNQPLLSPYEFFVCFAELDKETKGSTDSKTTWLPGGVYPMDYYSSSGGEWTNYYHRQAENGATEGESAGNRKKMSGKDALALIRSKNAAKKQAGSVTTTQDNVQEQQQITPSVAQKGESADSLD